jgi:hypothetical protein
MNTNYHSFMDAMTEAGHTNDIGFEAGTEIDTPTSFGIPSDAILGRKI